MPAGHNITNGYALTCSVFQPLETTRALAMPRSASIGKSSRALPATNRGRRRPAQSCPCAAVSPNVLPQHAPA
eukprot:6073287-Alexandrium_andersonii.AAC.1